ncbi:MAG: YfhO family protein [bacterium]|nr:YfhO family protein [bacterium]
MICLVLYLPGLAYAAESSRAASDTYRDVQNHVPWRMLLTNIIPTSFGRVDGPGSGPLWNLYWGGNTPADFWAYWERTSYAGIAAVMAFLLAPFWLIKTRNARGIFFFCVALFVILFMYGIASPFQYAVVQLVPILKGFRNPVRVSFLLAFALAVLSAQVFDYIWPMATGDRRQVLRRGLGFGALMAGLIVVAAMIGSRYAPDEQWLAQLLQLDRAAAEDAAHAVLHSGMLTQLALVGALVAVYIACGFGKLRGETGKWFVVALVFLDLFLFGHKFNTSVQSPVEFNAHNPISAKLKELQDTRPAAERFRFEWDPYAQANLRSVAWEVDSYNGYCMNQPLYLEQLRMAQGKNPERYRDLLNVRYRLHQLQNQEQMRRMGLVIPAWARPFAQQFGMAVEQRSNALPRVWFVPAAVLMADSNAIERVLSPHFDPRAEIVLAPDSATGSPLATNLATRGSAALTAYDHTRMTADSTADGPGYVVFSEWYFKGWRATVDGTAAPILRADVVLRAVPVAAGTHTITLAYHPREFYVGAALSGAGGVIALAAALTWLVGWIKERR